MFQNTKIPPPSQQSLITDFKPNATMNYHDSQWHNNELNHLDSCFSFLKPLLEAFKFINILKIIMKV